MEIADALTIRLTDMAKENKELRSLVLQLWHEGYEQILEETDARVQAILGAKKPSECG